VNTKEITVDQLVVQRTGEDYQIAVMEAGQIVHVLSGKKVTEAQCQEWLDQMKRCRECFHVAIHGGPGHDPSVMCRMGRTRPHCSCSACW
jgi:hypothetical protein